MSQADDLRFDTLTFLTVLHTHDAPLLQQRFLLPRVLTAINAQLTAPEPLPDNVRRRTELGTHRLRFIHFLCEASHLVAKTGRHLKPTLRVARWLAASPLDQLHTLFDAAYPLPPTRPHDELWQTYRLPGHTLVSPTVSLAPLFDILRQMHSDERLKLTTLLKLVPLVDDERESSEQILRGILNQLAWFGAIVWRGHSIVQLTDLGRSLLNRLDALPSPVELFASTGEGLGMGAGAGMRVQLTNPKLDLLHPTFAQLYELADYAELISVKPDRRYRLDRDRVQRALQRGLTLDGLLRFFESLIGDALPDRLHRQLRDWAAQLDQIAIRRVTILEVRDPATLTELTRAHRIRESLGRTLSPRAILVRPARLIPLVRQIKQRGLTPRLYFSDPRLGDPRLRDHSTTRPYDDPPRAQLYYAALLNHQQSDQLPAPYRIDYSIVLDLERQLTLHDRDVAQSLAEEASQILRRDDRPLTAVDAWPLADSTTIVGGLSSVVKLIEHALLANTPLTLSYHSPTYGDSTRTVEPLRLEWHTDVPYLIAYCRLRQDERTFRVDRILEIGTQVNK